MPLDDDPTVTAYHEAAHAVVHYRTSGFVGGDTSLALNEARHSFGHVADGVSDSFNDDHTIARILSCYAGGHAQRRFDRSLGDAGCSTDDEIAEDLLARRGWESCEQEFRDRSRVLVDQYWAEIEAVAVELQARRVLDDTEVEWLAEIAAGHPDYTPADLVRYRARKALTSSGKQEQS